MKLRFCARCRLNSYFSVVLYIYILFIAHIGRTYVCVCVMRVVSFCWVGFVIRSLDFVPAFVVVLSKSFQMLFFGLCGSVFFLSGSSGNPELQVWLWLAWWFGGLNRS